MLSRFRLLSLLLLVLTCTVSGLAQFTIKNVVFSGQVPFTSADLEAASGLHPGAALSKATLQAASQTLMDTGAFSDVDTSIDGPFAGVTVTFKVKHASVVLPARFENAVWLQPDKIVSDLHERVPLFNGTLPEAGTLTDSVAQALTALLAEKGVKASVSSSVKSRAAGRPAGSIIFSVDSPEVRLGSFDLAGLTPPLAPEVSRTLSYMTGRRYTNPITGFAPPEAILNLYRDAGYLDAAFDNLQQTLTSSGNVVAVKLSAKLASGEPYRLSAFNWTGTSVASADVCAKNGGLRAGDRASRNTLNLCLLAIATAYQRLGYLDVAVDPGPVFDHAAHQVAYTLTVQPGAQYHLASMTVNGLGSNQRAAFDREWRLQVGDLYDADYIVDFLNHHLSAYLQQHLTASYKLLTDPNTRTVDLVFSFDPDPSTPTTPTLLSPVASR